MGNKLRFQKKLMYRLKRDIGTRVSYYQPTQNDHDLATGAITRDYTVTNVRRALIYETDQIRSFIYDLSFIAANKNFTMGGDFDTAERLVVIERTDLPDAFLPSCNDHVVIAHRKYIVKKFNELEENTIIAFKVKEIKGIVVREFHTVSIEDVLTAGQTNEQS